MQRPTSLVRALTRGLTALIAFSAAGQHSDVRVDVTLVRVPFVATNAEGRPIHDLRPDELTVLDEGTPQEIKHLWTEMDLPLTAALVVDISSSQMGWVRAHRDSAKRFIERVMTSRDQILLATVDEQPRLLVDLTGSAEDLIRAADQIHQQRHAGDLFGEHCLPARRRSKPGRRPCIGTAIWDGVFHVVTTKLATAQGRKALVLLSDGLDLKASVHGLPSTIEAAQSADVTVYTVKYVSGVYLAFSPDLIIAGAREHGMELIAADTGGLAFNNPKNLDEVYGQIEADMRNQCVLAYAPKDRGDQGKWHRIEIRTTRPGVKIRAHAGYRVP